jgi:ribosomal protein S12 methylthiotransferase accessory factor YcaO
VKEQGHQRSGTRRDIARLNVGGGYHERRLHDAAVRWAREDALRPETSARGYVLDHDPGDEDRS